jgi:hypothetical protein
MGAQLVREHDDLGEAEAGAGTRYARPVRVDEAEQHLRAMLSAAGLDLARLEPEGAWDVFKEFAAQPVEGAGSEPDDDMVIFQYGISDDSWGGKGRRFEWSFWRQFSLYVGGEYDHMEHLQCNLFFEPTPELEEVGSGEAGFWPTTMHADFVAEVEGLPGYSAVLGATPVESEVRQEHV